MSMLYFLYTWQTFTMTEFIFSFIPKLISFRQKKTTSLCFRWYISSFLREIKKQSAQYKNMHKIVYLSWESLHDSVVQVAIETQ